MDINQAHSEQKKYTSRAQRKQREKSFNEQLMDKVDSMQAVLNSRLSSVESQIALLVSYSVYSIGWPIYQETVFCPEAQVTHSEPDKEPGPDWRRQAGSRQQGVVSVSDTLLSVFSELDAVTKALQAKLYEPCCNDLQIGGEEDLHTSCMECFDAGEDAMAKCESFHSAIYEDDYYFSTDGAESFFRDSGNEDLHELANSVKQLGILLSKLDEVDKMSAEDFVQWEHYNDYDPCTENHSSGDDDSVPAPLSDAGAHMAIATQFMALGSSAIPGEPTAETASPHSGEMENQDNTSSGTQTPAKQMKQSKKDKQRARRVARLMT